MKVEFEENPVLMDRQIRTAQLKTFGLDYRDIREAVLDFASREKIEKKRAPSGEYATVSLQIPMEKYGGGKKTHIQEMRVSLRPSVDSKGNFRSSLTLYVANNPIRFQREEYRGLSWDYDLDEKIRLKESNYVYPELTHYVKDYDSLMEDNRRYDFEYQKIAEGMAEALGIMKDETDLVRFRNFSFAYGEFAADLRLRGGYSSRDVVDHLQKFFLSPAGDEYKLSRACTIMMTTTALHQGRSIKLIFPSPTPKRPGGSVKVYAKTKKHVRVEIALKGDDVAQRFGIKATGKREKLNGGRYSFADVVESERQVWDRERESSYTVSNSFAYSDLIISDLVEPLKKLAGITDIINRDLEVQDTSVVESLMNLYGVDSAEEARMWNILLSGQFLKREDIPPEILKKNRDNHSPYYRMFEAVRVGPDYYYRLRK